MSTEVEFIDGTTAILQDREDEDPYKTLTLGLTLESEDIFDRKLKNEQEAAAFEYLAAKFYTSDPVYYQFVAFANTFFDEAMKEVAKNKIIAPSSNG